LSATSPAPLSEGSEDSATQLRFQVSCSVVSSKSGWHVGWEGKGAGGAALGRIGQASFFKNSIMKNSVSVLCDYPNYFKSGGFQIYLALFYTQNRIKLY
jgi:hypothetical protein